MGAAAKFAMPFAKCHGAFNACSTIGWISTIIDGLIRNIMFYIKKIYVTLVEANSCKDVGIYCEYCFLWSFIRFANLTGFMRIQACRV